MMNKLNNPQGPEKKAYQTPQLRVYGDIRKLTGLVNVAGMTADAMFGASKSH
jgi:hypothetical protein